MNLKRKAESCKDYLSELKLESRERKEMRSTMGGWRKK